MDTGGCLLCLRAAASSTQMVDCLSGVKNAKNESSNTKVIAVLNRHFWFQLDDDAAAKSFICLPCWTKVLSFHDFYEEVLTAHTNKVGLDIQRPDKPLKKEVKDGEEDSDADDNVKDEYFANNDSLAEHFKPEIIFSVGHNSELSDHDDFANDDHSSISSYQEPKVDPIKRKRGRPRKHPLVVFAKQSTPAKSKSVDPIGKYFSMKCTKCEAALCDLSDAMLHYKSQHKTSGYLMCCGRKYDQQKVIDKHFHFHEDPSEHKCFACGKIYLSSVLLDHHSKTKHNVSANTNDPSDNLLECTQCHRSFPTPNALTCHEIGHFLPPGNDGQPPQLDEDTIIGMFVPSIGCDVCKCSLDTFHDLGSHFRKVHGRSGSVNCCGKKYFKKFRLLQHCLWHVDPKKFDCLICGRNFHDTLSLIEHNTRFHTKNATVSVFQCETCDKNFPQRSQLTYHQQKEHMPDEDKKYECYHCGKRFVFLSFLRYHMRNHSERVDSFICDVCAKSFRSQYTYEQHYAVEHSNVCQKVQCELCGKWLKHAQTLARHMFIHREQVEPETCEQCGHVAPSKRALGCHRRDVHRGPTHKCLVCGKMFKKTQRLREHMAIHAGIKDLYKCWFCPKTFRCNANMYKHRKLVHSAEVEAQKLVNQEAYNFQS